MDAVSSFKELPLSDTVLQAVAEAGYDLPTDVQTGVIPLVLSGIDLIIQSQTGTGKTAAFGIPIAEMLDLSPGVVQALILAPTRELALQVTEELERVGCSARGLTVVTVYGGASMSDQIRRVKAAEVIVATPGRMLDLLRRKAAKIDQVRIFVLDEADEMLSMGFEKEVRDIVEYLPDERQSLMCSATVTESIRGVAADILSYPEFVSFGSDTLGAEDVDHYYYMVPGIGRLKDLHRVLQYEEPDSALIFCNTRDDSFRVANYLKRQGYDADVLNGDLPQSEREKVMEQMKAGRLQFLVATDIAARGIDISFLPVVINFTLPEAAEAYIHRTGRTGRAGREGTAISLISPREIGMFYQLRRAYKFDLKQRELPSDDDLMALRERRALERLLEGLDADQDLEYGRYLSFASSFSELPDFRQRLAKLMAFFVRERDRRREAEREKEAEAAAEPEPAAEREPAAEGRGGRTRRSRERTRSAERGAASPAREETPPPDRPKNRRKRARSMKEIEVNVGRDMVDSPDRLVSLLAELSGLGREDLGAAQVFDHHSIVEVRGDLVEDVVEAIDHEYLGEHEILVSR